MYSKSKQKLGLLVTTLIACLTTPKAATATELERWPTTNQPIKTRIYSTVDNPFSTKILAISAMHSYRWQPSRQNHSVTVRTRVTSNKLLIETKMVPQNPARQPQFVVVSRRKIKRKIS